MLPEPSGSCRYVRLCAGAARGPLRAPWRQQHAQTRRRV